MGRGWQKGSGGMLRIPAGHQTADAGELARRRGLRTGFLPQALELHGGLTVRQNTEAGAGSRPAGARLKANG